MADADVISRNAQKLQELYPAFRVRVEEVLKELASFGYLPRVVQAWRSTAEQAEAFRTGHSRVNYGFHNVTAANGTKEALAVDIWDERDLQHQKTHFMLHLLAAAQTNGLTTGMYWDLTPEKVATINAAIASKKWNTPVYAGYDPLHVEINGMTIQDVKAGKRPYILQDGQNEDPVTPGNTNTSGGQGGGPTPVPEGSGDTSTPIPQPTMGTTHYKVEDTATKQVREYDVSTAFQPVTLLPVPYVSQLGPGAEAHHNDCGAASAVMLIRAYLNQPMTPDEFYTKFALSGDPYLTITQMRNAMSSLGVLTDVRANLSLQDMFTVLAAGKPAIVLLRYKVLQAAGLTEKTFEGPHFAVVVGMDVKYIYLHDPLYTDPSVGNAHPYPLEIFWQAWTEVSTNPFPNPERSAIIPTGALGFRLVRKVRVKITTLNVRSGPNPGHPSVGTLKKDQIVEIFRELNGWGAIDDNHWILLSYTVPVQ